MRMILNDKPMERPGPVTLEALLRELKVKAERVATVVNGDVVPRDQRAVRHVQEGDRIDVLTLGGGG